MQVSGVRCKGALQLGGGPGHVHRQTWKWTKCRRAPALRAVAVDDLTVEANEMGVSFSPIHEDLGADVTGMDLSGGVSDTQGALVKKALDRYLLLRFRQQTLEPADEEKLLSCLPHDKEALKAQGVFENAIPGYPWLSVIASNMTLDDYYGLTTETAAPSRTTFFDERAAWHMDLSQQECSPMYSYMYMKKVPPQNPVTQFASSVKAYELLSDEQKKLADTLQVQNYAINAIFKLLGGNTPETSLVENGVGIVNPAAREELAKQLLEGDEVLLQDKLLPLVVEEKGTGIRSIHVTPYKLHSLTGMTTDESFAYLQDVLTPVTAERAWGADWQEGDVVVWKNRQVIHAFPPKKSFSDPRLFHLVFWPSDEPVAPVQGD